MDLKISKFEQDFPENLRIMRDGYQLKSIEIIPPKNSAFSLISENRSLPLSLPTDSIIGRKAFLEKEWDPRKIDFFVSRANAVAQPICLIDVGANVGLFARQCAARMPHIHEAYLYEPHPHNFELLERNLAAWSISSRLINAAIAEKNSVMHFYEDPDNCGNYSLNLAAMPQEYNVCTVTAIAAADEERTWLAHGYPVFYKSDTQGYDEVIAVNLSLFFWQRVHCAAFELWRIAKPDYDQQKFIRILDSFPFKSFESDPTQLLNTSDVLEFISHRDGLFNDLLCWR